MHFGPCCANRAAMLRESIFIQCEFERTAALLIQLWKVFDRSKGHICAFIWKRPMILFWHKILQFLKQTRTSLCLRHPKLGPGNRNQMQAFQK